ncbi:NnrS family protein [Thalassotalea fonticola]|uniref:NnrS family protein n=1 Tax=Thalassotalea fonticola TaxID=3065649 RepID=A0ABZ0GUJ4_9GAMM|nr:NnrS family protein [Colwelliaceae bacterium S1-1]
MQITDLAQEQKITPLFRLGFRPFFAFGALFSLLSILIWGGYLAGKISLNLYGGGTFWHMHEMIFGFVCAIVVGFLLTAVQNWTGQRGLSGKPLLLLFLLWFAGRLVMLFPDILGQQLSGLIDIAFLPVAATLLAMPIIKVKQTRNMFFVPLLLLFTLANIMMHLSITDSSVNQIMPSAYIAVMLVTLLMSIMAGRVTPMFTANGTQTTKVQPIPALELTTNVSLFLLVLSYFVHPFVEIPNTIKSALFLTAGISQMFRWLRWRPWITFGVPLLWSLHSALFFIWFGLIMLGIGHIFDTFPLNHVWHLLTIGGMGGLILAMISRVTLGHTGRALQPPKIMNFAFILMLIATMSRVFGPWFMPESYSAFINFSVLCWFSSYGIFVIKYGPMLLTPRKDGRPG